MKLEYIKWLTDKVALKNGKHYSERTVQKYSSSIDIIKKQFNINLYSHKNFANLLKMKENLYNNKEFIKKNKKGKNMYSRAVENYVEFIYSNYIFEFQKEIEKIENDNKLSYEEKNSYIETLCSVRNPLFQRLFRKNLIKEFDGKCALCKINDKRLLIGSHILAYSKCTLKSDMFNGSNGLLLCAIHDALFDKHIISFDEHGKICISKTLDRRLYNMLNINENIKIEPKYYTEERKKFMILHFNEFNQKENT